MSNLVTERSIIYLYTLLLIHDTTSAWLPAVVKHRFMPGLRSTNIGATMTRNKHRSASETGIGKGNTAVDPTDRDCNNQEISNTDMHLLFTAIIELLVQVGMLLSM